LNTKLIKNTSLYTIGNIIPKILAMVLLPVFTRYLTPGEYGILNYTNSIISFLYVLSLLSLNTFILRYYFKMENKIERKRLIGNISLFLLIYNFILLFLELILAPIVIDYFSIKVAFKPYFLLALLNNFLNLFAVVPLIIFRLKEKALKFLILNLSKTLFSYGFSLFFIVVLDYGVLGRYYANILASIIFLLVYIYIIYKNAIFNINMKQIKTALKFSFPLVPGAFSYMIINLLDRIMLERFVPLDQMGIYSIGYTLGFAINVFVQGAYHAFEPLFFKNYGNDNFGYIYTKIKSHYFSLAILLGFGVSIFSREIILIFTTPDYLKAYKIVPLIVIAAIFKAKYLVEATVTIASSNNKIITFATFGGALINIIVNLLFMPKIGIYAAALSTIASFVFITIVINILNYRYEKFKDTLLFKDFISITIFVIFIVAVLVLINVTTIYTIIVKVLILLLYSIIVKKIYNIKLKNFINNLINKVGENDVN